MNSSRHFALIVSMAATFSVAASAQSGPYVEELSCTRGPHRLQLPGSLAAVRKLGPIRQDTVLETEDWGTYRTYERKLIFDGLELVVVTFSNDPERYLVAGATLTTSAWTLAGRLRVDNSATSALAGLPVEKIPRDGDLKFSGDVDFIHVTLAEGRVKRVIYACYTG